MALSRNHHFPPEYEQLLLAAYSDLPFTFPCKTPELAKSMRLRMYYYFRRLRDEHIRMDLVEMADSISLVVQDRTLVFQSKSDNWDAKLIREGLQASGIPAGQELHLPELMGSKLKKQITAIRERKAGGQSLVPPYTSGK